MNAYEPMVYEVEDSWAGFVGHIRTVLDKHYPADLMRTACPDDPGGRFALALHDALADLESQVSPRIVGPAPQDATPLGAPGGRTCPECGLTRWEGAQVDGWIDSLRAENVRLRTALEDIATVGPGVLARIDNHHSDRRILAESQTLARTAAVDALTRVGQDTEPDKCPTCRGAGEVGGFARITACPTCGGSEARNG